MFLIFMLILFVIVQILMFIRVFQLNKENGYLINKLDRINKIQKDREEIRQKIFEKEYEKIYGKPNTYDVVYNKKD